MKFPKNFYIPPVLFKNIRGGNKLEETLYNIEIHKDEDGGYLGKLFSDVDGVKEFKNDHLDQLLRDMTIDMQLALEEFANRTGEYSETPEVK